MDFKEARRRMIDSQVRTNDVSDLRIQAAIEAVPREIFLPGELRDKAYVDADVGYAPGRRLLAPRSFAKLLAVAGPRPTEVVLDVACGSGYSTAVLARLAEMVVAIESDEALALRAQENLEALGVTNAAVVVGPPSEGAAKQGPFDVIFIGGVIDVEPVILLRQLKDRGRLAALKREQGVVRGVVYTRSGQAIGARTVFDAASAPALPEFEAPKTFVF
ncbi:MAG: methyltransferase domain-containing protein [Alphaproteobacteria bacterium]|nr:methyltransferase domain-containing protein [Alphaproteobacteria bacterium]